jgi:hypothetical protein
VCVSHLHVRRLFFESNRDKLVWGWLSCTQCLEARQLGSPLLFLFSFVNMFASSECQRMYQLPACINHYITASRMCPLLSCGGMAGWPEMEVCEHKQWHQTVQSKSGKCTAQVFMMHCLPVACDDSVCCCMAVGMWTDDRQCKMSVCNAWNWLYLPPAPGASSPCGAIKGHCSSTMVYGVRIDCQRQATVPRIIAQKVNGL